MTWDLSADVVVVGFGAAGVSAALEAAGGGAEVIAIDRFNGGGATRISGGIVYAGGGTSVQRAAGVTDSADAMYAYLSRETGDVVEPATLRRFVDESPATIEWLKGHGVPFEASVCPYKTSYPNNKYYLYYSGSENAGGFREAAPPAPRGHRPKGRNESGKVLYAALSQAAIAKGVRLESHTKATGLITDEAGTVLGVECRTLADAPVGIRRRFSWMARKAAKPGMYYPPLRKRLHRALEQLEAKYGKVIRIEARSGVVLSAGGFIADRAMVRQYAPDHRHGLALGTTADDGSGIRLGTEVGAATDRLGNVSVWRFLVPPSVFQSGLLVNAAGQRFVDESRYGAAVGQALIGQPDAAGWLLVDSELLREARSQLRSQSLWFQRMQAEGLLRTAIRGATLEEVAARAGIESEGLRATVDAHNRAVANDEPDPLGKPGDVVRPIRVAPFALLDFSIKASNTNPTPMMTLGGLVVDEFTGAVKSTEGKPISGLYAAGRTAVGICSDSYVSGLSLADCIFAGRRAGLHAAERKRAHASR